MSIIAPKQWQISIIPFLNPSDIEDIPNPPPRWTGAFAKLKLPEGDPKRNLGHSVWVSVYSKANIFYQVGFLEGEKSGGEVDRPIFWQAFYATTQLIFNPGDPNSVITRGDFKDGKLTAQAGETYYLYIEMDESTITLSIWDENDVPKVTIDFPDASKLLGGGNLNPRASFTVESTQDFSDEALGTLGPFTFDEMYLQVDETQYGDLPLIKREDGASPISVEILFNQPPLPYGIGRIDSKGVAVGRGLPRPQPFRGEI